MNDRQAIGYLRESRESLNRQLGLYNSICQYSSCPGLDRKLNKLLYDQDYLEELVSAKLSGCGCGQNFGFIVQAAIIGGMGLAALYGWIWKQRTEAKVTEAYLECLNRLMSQGVTEGEAAQICSGNYGGSIQDLSDLMKVGLYATLGVAGLYVFFKYWK